MDEYIYCIGSWDRIDEFGIEFQKGVLNCQVVPRWDGQEIEFFVSPTSDHNTPKSVTNKNEIRKSKTALLTEFNIKNEDVVRETNDTNMTKKVSQDQVIIVN